MVPYISQDTACGVYVILPSGSFHWFNTPKLGAWDQELLRLETKYFSDSLEREEGNQWENIYKNIEGKAQKIKASGSSLPLAAQFEGKLEDLKADAPFLKLLHTGVSDLIRAGKIWGDDKYREMVTFTKQRFGPAYALLVVCIFGTKGRYGDNRLTKNQLAKIVQRLGQDIRQGQRLYCPALDEYWNRLAAKLNHDFTCAQLPGHGMMQPQAEERVSEDPQGNSTHRSAQNWHSTVLNKYAYQPGFQQIDGTPIRSGTTRCHDVTESEACRKRRRFPNNTAIIRHVDNCASNIDRLRPEFDETISVEWGAVPPRGLSGPRDVIDTHLEFAGTLHNYDPHLGTVQLDKVAIDSGGGNRSTHHFQAITVQSEGLQAKLTLNCGTLKQITLPRPVPQLQTLCLDDTERRLYQYFITQYCPIQTLYNDVRHNSLLQGIPSNPPREFMAAIFCVASLYIGGPEEIYFDQVIKFLQRAMQDGMPNSEIGFVAGIIRLLIQYHIVKRDIDQSWVFHIKGFRSLQPMILDHPEARSLTIRITYESILKLVPVPEEDDLPNDGLSIDYLLNLDDLDLHQIRDYGFSAELLHLLGCINVEVHHANSDPSRRLEAAQSLLARCETIEQTTTEEHKIRRACIEKTAESYIHMARTIIHWQLLGCASSNTMLCDKADALATCILQIPTEDEYFTAQYPLAPAFWAVIFSPKVGQKCYDLLATKWTDRPTNISRAMRVADLVRRQSQAGIVIDMNLLASAMESLKLKELSLG